MPARSGAETIAGASLATRSSLAPRTAASSASSSMLGRSCGRNCRFGFCTVAWPLVSRKTPPGWLLADDQLDRAAHLDVAAAVVASDRT